MSAQQHDSRTEPDQESVGSEPGNKLSPRRRKLFLVMLFVLDFCLAEVAVWSLYTSALPHFEKMRLQLLGRPMPLFKMCVGQPYLLYAPAPNYARDGRPEHSEQGYRGRTVPVPRTPGVARIICLGGSTTYGTCVRWADEAYPAQLERILSQSLPDGIRGVEVINGGLPNGTTAELLTHYHFKFHYYRPDLVIINTGGNDAWAMSSRSDYQPDYSHWNQIPFATPPLPTYTRWLMHSRVASLAGILFRCGTARERFSGLPRPKDAAPPVRWYSAPGGATRAEQPLPRKEMAFAHNLEALVEEIRRDGAKVLLVPFRADMNPVHLLGAVPPLLGVTESVLREIAAEHGIPVAPFPSDVISPRNWANESHLNAAGCREKAAHIAEHVRRALGWEKAHTRER